MIKSVRAIFDRNTLLHLRLPFSFFLLPVFLFALSEATYINYTNLILVFTSLHFFIYPGSNSYNSYMDKDVGSIGGLKHPPPVTHKLYVASIIMDSIGLFLCLFISLPMVLLMLVYIGVSKAYSWKKIRLKKYGVLGWLVVMLFQGGYTFLLVNMAAENGFNLKWFTTQHLYTMVVASLLIGGFYPLTQIYQHEEDSSRGDFTISYHLGVNGTFIFSAALFTIACFFCYYYFGRFYAITHFLIFICCLLPVIIYFLYWFALTLKNKQQADYSHAMQMTFISSICMIVCFGVLFYLNRS